MIDLFKAVFFTFLLSVIPMYLFVYSVGKYLLEKRNNGITYYWNRMRRY